MLTDYSEEIVSCMCYFASAINSVGVNKVIFTGSMANDYDFCQVLAHRLGLPAQIGDPLAGVCVPVSDKQRLKVSVAKKTSVTPQRRSSVYIVKRGDTLEKIARRHSTSISALLRLNNLRLKDRIYVKQKLKVSVAKKTSVTPQRRSLIYIVKRGDTLEKIARKHNTTISTLLKLNRLRLRDRIYVRQKLKIPG